ncbi:MAG: PEGA domain-containing protein [Methanoregula sp.]|nr:PEGA domain-containing protein [Methanoregula sp.]
MSYTNNLTLCCLVLACCNLFMVIPVHAFTANSLDITVDKNGDAIATFRFTLEGFIENSIPQSTLEEELKKGLTTSTEPPELKSMDRSSAVLLMKKFADTTDVATGTEYRTASMDFKKAEVALQNSALGGVVTADFSPEKIVLTFPDSYQREFSNVDVLPAVSHIVTDPVTIGQTSFGTNGSMNITSSPLNVKVYLDSTYIGEAPAVFPDIASGTHRVEFSKDGFTSLRENVTINEGKTTNIMVVLEYIPPSISGKTSSFPGFVVPVVIIALIAVLGGGYYYWNKKIKSEEEKEDDTENESG